MWHRLGRAEEGCGVLEGADLVGGELAQPDHLGVDPGSFVDVGAAADLQVEALGAGEVDRLHEAVVDRAEYLGASMDQMSTPRAAW